MNKNIYGKGLNKNIWHYNYCNKKILNIYDYFSKQDILILKKLNINIENKLYSQREFDVINELLFNYYEVNQNDEIIQSITLKKLNISKEQYRKILDIFSKIENDFDL